MTIPYYLGLCGMIFILAGFTLDLLRILNRDHIVYLLLNFFGAGLMAYYAYDAKITLFLILDIVWCIFALYEIILKYSKKKSVSPAA